MLFLLFRFVLFRIHFSLVRLVRQFHLLDALLPISLNSCSFRTNSNNNNNNNQIYVNFYLFDLLFFSLITIRFGSLVRWVCVCIYVFFSGLGFDVGLCDVWLDFIRSMQSRSLNTTAIHLLLTLNFCWALLWLKFQWNCFQSW